MKLSTQKMKMDQQAQDRALKQQQMQMQAATSAADRASREQIAKIQLARELAVHPLSQGVIAAQNPGLAAGVGG